MRCGGSGKRWLLCSLASALLLATAGCGLGGEGGSSGSVTIGAVTFAENQLVAEMYALVLEEAGYSVERRFNFQRREGLYPQIEDGAVDLAPEYTASLLTFLDPETETSPQVDENVAKLLPLLEEDDLLLLAPSKANDTNSFVVTEETAKRLNLEAVSDLAPHADDLRFGGPPECPERTFCLQGLRDVYGISLEMFTPLDAGGPLTIAALGSGEIDIALMFSTSGVIAERGWVVLEDDKELQAADHITPLIRKDAVESQLEDALNDVSDRLTTAAITDLNARVETNNEDVRTVAEGFLEEEGLL